MVSAVITAAGIGKRMNTGMPKQYINLRGMPILAYTIDRFEKCSSVDEIIIVSGKRDIDYVRRDIVEKYGFSKVKKITEGGSERQYSVYNGIKCTDKKSDVILIHDGVRPFVSTEFIDKIILETLEYGCCVLGTRVKDTIKKCDHRGKIVETPDRNTLWIAQTPQSFKAEIIRSVYKKAEEEGFLGTDDSMLAEKYGYSVKMTEGDYSNIKITTPEDLYFGQAVIQQQEGE